MLEFLAGFLLVATLGVLVAAFLGAHHRGE